MPKNISFPQHSKRGAQNPSFAYFVAYFASFLLCVQSTVGILPVVLPVSFVADPFLAFLSFGTISPHFQYQVALEQA